MERQYNILIQPDEDGGFHATVPSVPGVVDQGDTIEETYRNTLTALQFTIECMIADGEELPPSDPGPGEVRSAKVSA